jgi:hypothetical protein
MRIVWMAGLAAALACSGQSERGPEQNDPGSVTSREGSGAVTARDSNLDDSLAPSPDSLPQVDGAAESRPAVVDSQLPRSGQPRTP